MNQQSLSVPEDVFQGLLLLLAMAEDGYDRAELSEQDWIEYRAAKKWIYHMKEAKNES